MRLSEAVRGYLLSISVGNYGQSTVNLYRHYLAILVRHLQDPDPGDIADEHPTEFAAWLKRDYRHLYAGGG